MIAPEQITAVILSGGRGSRMGGLDKGLQTFNGVPLAMQTLTRLQMGGGVGRVMINANRNLAAYESFGVSVWPDSLSDFAGPLAGFLTALEHCETPYLLTAPCDTPLLPLDLANRLARALQVHDADIAMASAPEPDSTGRLQVRSQPVFCLLRASLLRSLQDFINNGGRKIGAWTALHKTVLVPFDLPADDTRAFRNANSLTELRQLENSPT
ncbi:MAG: molybdenum cofactor guanylyltransferase MobA [Rhodoferax sp.]